MIWITATSELKVFRRGKSEIPPNLTFKKERAKGKSKELRAISKGGRQKKSSFTKGGFRWVSLVNLTLQKLLNTL